jgi:hypothetical protein
MPWTCPKCGVRVGSAYSLPRTDLTYTCPVCRLALAFNGVRKKMEPARLPPDTTDREPVEPTQRRLEK